VPTDTLERAAVLWDGGERLHGPPGTYERGQLCVRRTSTGDADALRRVLRHVMRDMASRWELAHRRHGTATRTGRAGKQLELLGSLAPASARPARLQRRRAAGRARGDQRG
jgi:hypothetical protein